MRLWRPLRGVAFAIGFFWAVLKDVLSPRKKRW